MLFRATFPIVLLLAAVLLIATTALADLRSPDGTAELGTTLAEDPAVRSVISTAVVDALLEDASRTTPDVSALLPLVRPLLASAVDAALATDAGRAALATTITDAARQLTFDGPIVLDLRSTVLAAAATAPEPLATIARTAVERGSVGVVVLGAAEHDRDPAPRTDAELARVGGLTATTATTLAWALLLVMLVAGLAPTRGGRTARLRAGGTALLLAGVPVTLLLRSASDRIIDRVAAQLAGATGSGDADASGGPLDAVVPSVVEGVVGLLGRTADVALLIAGLGTALLALGLALRHRG